MITNVYNNAPPVFASKITDEGAVNSKESEYLSETVCTATINTTIRNILPFANEVL